jgi:glycosyltransferase involved in cell wall biosynthesis
MRILVAAERVGPAGGMERYLDVVLPGLAARGATVHVVAREITPTAAEGATSAVGSGAAIAPGITVERVAWSDEHDEPDDAARAATAKVLAGFAPDLVLAQNVMDAGVVEVLRAAPRLAYQAHDHRPFCPNGDRVYPRSGRNCIAPLGAACALHALLDGCAYGPRPRTLALIRRRERLRDAIAAADVTVVTSDYVGARAIASGVPAERIALVPPPLPDDAYADPCGNATGASGKSASRTVFFAGRMVPQKGLLSLVRALSRIAPERRPSLVAYGDGPERVLASREAAARGVAMDAPGAASAGQVRAAIDAADVVAVPSLWAEPFGLIGIEAFARGRPVLAYDGGGVRAWLADGINGLAVRTGDEAALARALERLATDDALRERLGTRARAEAERYRLQAVLDQLLATASLADPRSAPPVVGRRQ